MIGLYIYRNNLKKNKRFNNNLMNNNFFKTIMKNMNKKIKN